MAVQLGLSGAAHGFGVRLGGDRRDSHSCGLQPGWVERRRKQRRQSRLRSLLFAAAALALPNTGKTVGLKWMPTTHLTSSAGPRVSTTITSFVAGSAAHAYDDIIAEAAKLFRVEPAMIRSVMQAESAFDPFAVSRAGAMGLMQLMPETYADLTARYRLGDDPYDPASNIAAGAAYLREMFDRFGAPGAFAAYNAGPGRMIDHLSHGRRLPAETERYVARIRRGVPGGELTSKLPLVGLENDTAFAGETQHGDDAIARPVPAARPLVAAGLQRGATMADRSGALFTLLRSSRRAADALVGEQRASWLPTGWEAIGTIDEGRGGAVFVPLGRGEGGDLGLSGAR
jgi:hypothetical protein